MTRLATGSARPLRTVYRTLNIAENSYSRSLRSHPALRLGPYSSRCRTYATEKPESSKKDDAKPSKPAPGFDNLYNQPSMNAQQTKADSTNAESIPSKPAYKCSSEDVKALDEIAEYITLGGMKPMKEHIPEYFEHCKQTGDIVPQLREAIELQKKGELFAFRNMMRMAGIAEIAAQHCYAKPKEQWLTLQASQDQSGQKMGKGSKVTDEAVPCSPEDQKLIDEVLKTIKEVFPQKVYQPVIPILEEAKAKGITPEIREILDIQKKEGSLSLSIVLKLVRLRQKAMSDQLKSSIEREEGSSGQTGNQSDKGAGGSGGQGGSGGSGGPGGGFKFDLNTAILALFSTYITYKVVAPAELAKDITWQEFNTAFLQKGLVEKLVVFDEKRVKVFLHREALRSQHPDSPAVNENFFYYFTIGSIEGFEKRLEQVQDHLQIPLSERIPVSYESGGGGLLPTILINLIPTAVFLGGLYYMSRRGGGGAGGSSGIFGMGRSRAKKFNHETDIKVKFADVAGMDEAKVEIMEFVSFLKQPERFQKLGAKIPRGAILSGPPGTGKTLLAKATAGESGVPFFSVSGAEFVEIFVGVGPSRVRDLFANARKNTPCIIFIDEIDAIGRARGSKNFSGGNDEREATLNQILTEMDGFNTSEQVVVLAGTNRPDVLDSALMRPGRFDRHIAIDRPTMEGRKQIFGVHLKKIVTKEDMEHLTGRLAALTPGFSGADIANCANEAALIAARENADTVEMKHFEAAIERTIGGLEKKSLVLSPEEKRVVAYHEAGHAICGWFFKYADPLLKVSIIPRGQGALGYAQYLPAGDTYLMNEFQFMDRMAMTLGGRVSEELHFETVTSGASDDFNKVTRMATAMVTKYGMSPKIGRVYYEDDSGQSLHKPFSEQTAREIDVEVKRIADAAYKQCKDLLTEKKKEVGLVAEELLKKEMLVRDDLIRLLGRRPFEDKAEFEKYFSGGQGAGQKSAPPPPPHEIGNTGELPGDTPPAPQPAMKQHDAAEEGERKA